MPRVFIPGTPGESIQVSGREAKYVLSVLRGKPGDNLTLIDPEGRRFEAVISSVESKSLTARILGPAESAGAESPLRLVLIQGILKGQKMDLVIQKATELGATGIVPLVTERTQVGETRKLGRWRLVAQEAVRQSGRSLPPAVEPPVALKEFFAQGKRSGIVFYEGEGMRLKEAVGLISPSGEVCVAIGPEGGFSPDEARLAVENGLLAVNLGRRILRAETAAIAALAALQIFFGDMG